TRDALAPCPFRRRYVRGTRSRRAAPPELVQASGVDGIKAQFIDELEDDGLGGRVVARNRQGNATGSAFRPAQLQEVSGVDVVERLDHRPSELLRHPLALRQSRFNRFDAAIPLARV